ncbi:N-acetyl-beta-glucosaminyl-glycoprotein 4-beta-N-acetylgalactosaminyltransferase 1 [Rhinatrema bivittatum]|uniref:N-acetyl-beta-glucosaminyl-glycoprotein 4-beta-N-acetylgalactosaminyltransferase 1 n=1 Tax=Rhinatrema bivittatum TaxID=194408 RepID=UPI00112E49AD|nr:N-acetyl-beta-glucosaminyl-glycoprotein 4-beta-N-acetylgalactosaminyltransferase 1 [Rhinatrema bivittatum]
MLWFPVKKIRKQFKLLLLLVLLTFAVWFTYLHINLVRQGKALRLHFGYNKDGERLSEGTDAGRRAAGAHASSLQRRAEDSNESREDEQMMEGQNLHGDNAKGSGRLQTLNLTRTVFPWDEQNKGKANLHVFEDWCGGAVRQLRKNLHFPLYPHTRTTVKKLAVSPKWKNYGLRIFGYIHPFKDGDFQFAVASDDNSEFWFSTDESPANAKLLVFVGKTGSEWTAPGEFTKFSSQVSKPIRLMTSRRYYFELLHKQDDRGSDHVEVGWRIFLPSLKFEVIDSSFISLYADESSLKMNKVDHIPQSLASHSGSYLWEAQREDHGADMLKPDPRDTFFLTPLIEPSWVENVLVPCAYTPTYVVKDFPIARYQGLQFVYLSFVYPNDFTRLTHMETENKCFYRESSLYLEKIVWIYKYMKMDEEEEDPHKSTFLFLNPENFLEEEDGVASPGPSESPLLEKEKSSLFLPNQQASTTTDRKEELLGGKDYEDDVDDYIFHRKQRKLIDSLAERQQVTKETYSPGEISIATSEGFHDDENADFSRQVTLVHSRSLSWVAKDQENQNQKSRNALLPVTKHGRSTSSNLQPHISIPIFASKMKQASNKSVLPKGEKKSEKEVKKSQSKVYVTRLQPGRKKVRKQESVFPGMLLYPKKLRRTRQSSRIPAHHPSIADKLKITDVYEAGNTRASWLTSSASRERAALKRKSIRRERGGNRKWSQSHGPVELEQRERRLRNSMLTSRAGPLSREGLEPPTSPQVKTALDYNSSEISPAEGMQVTSFMKMSEVTESQQEKEEGQAKVVVEELPDYSYEDSELRQNWLEDSINWQRTFSVSSVDFELLRSDWNDLRCNVSGNLQLSESEVVDVVAQYMEKLNEKNGGIYTLLRIINVEKRRDSARGNRYLIELELIERGRRTVRLSEYVYVLLHHFKQNESMEANEEEEMVITETATESQQQQTSPWNVVYGKPVLCQPVRLNWRHNVMVHFVIPVKNQARWVQQFITDMEGLYHETKDENFNIILVDFDSEDMDVEKALKDAKLPRYLYLKRTGNFERSAGLQAGVDSIEDSHTIVFLCDLHIHFPLSVLDSVRKHCVEGKLAFAPIVMRLGCGSSPQDPRGYWEVNGFGLFGIYKSDFDKVGGMNTEEFRDRWGGEDWELLDRVLQNGLEVERLRLRNFYHYYHSKRGMWNTRSKNLPPKE